MFGASSAATNKTGGMFGLLSMLASTPWLQFNPLSLMNANKGVFGVNLGICGTKIERMAAWVDQVMNLWERGAIKPKIARTFSFDQAAAAHHFIQDRKNIGKVPLTP
jgi:NADPH:quinone reductase-like Zn-dependent oxidoreductase